LTEAGVTTGKVDAICTVMNGLDRAVCRWTFFLNSNSAI